MLPIKEALGAMRLIRSVNSYSFDKNVKIERDQFDPELLAQMHQRRDERTRVKQNRGASSQKRTRSGRCVKLGCNELATPYSLRCAEHNIEYQSFKTRCEQQPSE